MEPSAWGPLAWRLVHAAAHAAPAAAFERLMECLCAVLPCRHCREALREYAAQWPVHVLGQRKWAWWIHEQVSQKLGKDAPTFAQLQKRHLLCPPGVSADEVCAWVFLCVAAARATGDAAAREAAETRLAPCLAACFPQFDLGEPQGDVLYWIAAQRHLLQYSGAPESAWAHTDLDVLVSELYIRCGVNS